MSCPTALPAAPTPCATSSSATFTIPITSRRPPTSRRLGGNRRRREKTIEGAYDLPDGLRSADAIRRVVEAVTFDLLGMESTIARANALLRAAGVAARLLETGELERRIADLEAALAARQPDSSSPFDVDLPEIDTPSEPSLN